MLVRRDNNLLTALLVAVQPLKVFCYDTILQTEVVVGRVTVLIKLQLMHLN